MKRILLITILIVGLTASYGFAQMGQGMMGSGQGMMDQGYMGGQSQQQTGGSGYYPCPQMMGQGHMGGMMGPGMMGGYGMMGQGHMGGYGMMGQGGGYGMMGQGGGYGMMGPGMMGQGRMGGYGYRGNDPKAFKKYQGEYQEYLNDTADLRRKLHNKRFEYIEAARNPDTTRKSLMKLEREMQDIQLKIYEKAPGE